MPIRLADLPTPPRVLLPKLTHLTLEMCLAARRAERLKSLKPTVEKLSKADKNFIEQATVEGLDTSIKIN
ncbi:hypothetical protein AX14_009441 [Amanita brunnescens Koide BX004]|nr:hypothetical protein AX14_009441 [Amanita brunnescens Koide BX004]